MEGRIHSIETFGTVDGPGIRYVIFFKGCPMRCAYCHNPDTWELSGGEMRTAKDLVDDYFKYEPFLKGGGITATGGEPLLQLDFLIELFEEARGRGVHTCLDTSGITFNPDSPEIMSKFDRLMAVTDLIMLDIKHIDPDEHIKLVKQPNTNIFKFLRYINDIGKTIWIRHVLVPGITYIDEYLDRLGYFLGEFRQITVVDVLPYHDMGIVKYEKLGIDYPLKGVSPLTNDDAFKAREVILNGMKRKRKEMNSGN